MEISQNRKLFISHSSLDKEYVEKIIEIIELIGVPSKNIFCSSYEGYGVSLGEDFLNRLKTELNNEIMVLFILSKNFYLSPVCLCEMGATWIKTSKHIPILIPPFTYIDIKGVIPSSTKSFIITDSTLYNSFKEELEKYFDLSSINSSIWERKRNNIIEQLLHLTKKNALPLNSSDTNSDDIGVLEKDLKILLNYMNDKSLQTISFQKIHQNINNRFNEEKINQLIESFPDILRRHRYNENKYGIKLL